jgi:hypothetical protein
MLNNISNKSLNLNKERDDFILKYTCTRLKSACKTTGTRRFNMNETIQEIKTLFAKNNIPVFGIAKSSHLENDAHGYRPSDSLFSAESIICLGVPFPKGVFQYPLYIKT